MTIVTAPFDATRYLDDTATQAELLAEVLATGDQRAIVHVLGTVALARGMTELAQLAGIGRTELYAALADVNRAGHDAIAAILRALTHQLVAEASAGSPGA